MGGKLTDLDLSGPGIIEVLSQHMPGVKNSPKSSAGIVYLTFEVRTKHTPKTSIALRLDLPVR
jgi:hypothetical protein